jgi:hypothetical protein
MCFPQGVPRDMKREVKGIAKSKRLGNIGLSSTFYPLHICKLTALETGSLTWSEYLP